MPDFPDCDFPLPRPPTSSRPIASTTSCWSADTAKASIPWATSSACCTAILLRFVHQPNFAELATREDSPILATIEASNLTALFAEFGARCVTFAQGLVKQAWGGTDFHVRDPDGNVVSFVQYRSTTGA